MAFIVLNALGLDIGAYSLPYVARWTEGDVAIVTETGTRVVKCAQSILQALDG